MCMIIVTSRIVMRVVRFIIPANFAAMRGQVSLMGCRMH